MKRALLTTVTLAMVMVASSAAFARKKPLDHSVYDSWQSTSAPTVSDDGRTLVYQVNPQEGDSRLFINDLVSGRELAVDRGASASISDDGNWAVFTIKPPFAETRKAKIMKKKADRMPKDSLGYVDLRTFELKKIAGVAKVRTSLSGTNLIIFETGEKDSLRTIVLNPDTGRSDTLKHLDRFAIDKNGTRLAAVFKKEKKDSLSADAVVLFHTGTMRGDTLSKDKKFYSLPVFNDNGDKLAFLASADTNKTGNRNCGIFLYEEMKKGPANFEELIPQDYSAGLPEGMAVNENAGLRFSRLSDRLFLGVGEMIPPKDTSLVDFETASLDIWNWDIYLTPPAQKAQRKQLEEATCDAVINLGSSRHAIIPLSSNPFERMSLADGGECGHALILDSTPYLIHSTWDQNSLTDVYLTDLDTGVRTLLFKGLNGRPSMSPTGKYLLWYSLDDLGIHCYDIAKGTETNLTEGIDGIFHDDEDDHPMTPPQIGRTAWYDDDKAILLTEKHDIWRIRPDGSRAVCLTGGKGRAGDIQYRYITLTRNDISPALMAVGVGRTISDKSELYLTAFDRKTKENGFARVRADKCGLLESFTARNVYQNAAKALNADVIAFRKGDFKHPYDVFVTRDNWASEQQLSHINPQMSEYRWGDVQLVHWNAYDGTPLDGLLYTPEDMDEGTEYPMMIYFYEKNSQTLYSHISPAPSRSIICIPFYVSRGYVVFVPDIKYKDGHPGESAYNCICSGAEAMCSRFPFIDKERMAIQGQSWGGYQTAYLVTRTDMFAAAGAGAPVGNMTSAYGGIRWSSGMVRAMQYEHGQSRIGKSLWDEGGLDLYIENSPVFHTENVTTPVLIMHNDKDGAVPWYQGIEFFMALRRFGHPAWLLEYNDEEHNLVQRRNCKDLTIRLQQFFDHYLMGEPMPAWMKKGVPITRKGQYFGLETD